MADHDHGHEEGKLHLKLENSFKTFRSTQKENIFCLTQFEMSFHTVINFIASAGFKDLLKNFNHSECGFWELTLGTKQITPN